MGAGGEGGALGKRCRHVPVHSAPSLDQRQAVSHARKGMPYQVGFSPMACFLQGFCREGFCAL